MPAQCRGGSWYLLAARDLARTPLRTRNTPDGVALTTTRDALEKGLIAEPDHAELLAFVVFGSGVDPERIPAVPADACTRLKVETDASRYVCASQSLRDGRGTPEGCWRKC